MRAKVGVLTSWLILILGIVAAFEFQSGLWLLAPLASILVRHVARVSAISRPDDIRAGVAIIFVLLCMWVDLLFHVPGWLRTAAQFVFLILLLVGVVVWMYHDIRILAAPVPKTNA